MIRGNGWFKYWLGKWGNWEQVCRWAGKLKWLGLGDRWSGRSGSQVTEIGRKVWGYLVDGWESQETEAKVNRNEMGTITVGTVNPQEGTREPRDELRQCVRVSSDWQLPPYSGVYWVYLLTVHRVCLHVCERESSFCADDIFVCVAWLHSRGKLAS